ncbi:thioredoxin fold domain-containing protein [Gramella sp. AN32]|uniref:Thioredoxin family protein n=1 Tax=Christiangramia antarctica TaxID=2058158 RepID=A0ABW5X1Z4_9FLAO|nr:thioredoxin fold domain-containing protein [Gramella sp. AN32]MCM4156659.1 thioredoxin family protein [Gramella sp. AN32]
MKNILSCLLLIFFTGVITAQEIKWMSMNEALDAQKEKPKKIFVDAYTVWCGPCKMLDKNTFGNEDVIEYVNKHFYAVKFNAEGDEKINYEGKEFTNRNYKPEATGRNGVHDFALAMGVNAYPTMVFFDEKGKYLSPLKGYLTPKQLEIFLKIFATDDYKEVKTDEEWKLYQEQFESTFSG